MAQTAANIRESELLFRLGIAARLLSEIFFILLPLVLFKLLKAVNKIMAVLMVVLVHISVAMDYLNTANLIDALSLVTDPEVSKYFEPFQDRTGPHFVTGLLF